MPFVVRKRNPSFARYAILGWPTSHGSGTIRANKGTRTTMTEVTVEEIRRRAELLLDSGWVPRTGDEGAVYHEDGNRPGAQISSAVWQAMVDIQAARRLDR